MEILTNNYSLEVDIYYSNVSTLLNPYCEIQDCVLVLLHEKK
jgi:hypothetical protein